MFFPTVVDLVTRGAADDDVDSVFEVRQLLLLLNFLLLLFVVVCGWHYNCSVLDSYS